MVIRGENLQSGLDGLSSAPPATMKEIELLKELQDLELLARKTADQKARIKTLREEIPDPLLGHYDRLMNRGKKGVALVQRVSGGGLCTGCRMRLPSGPFVTLLRDEDVAMCENCSRYLLLAPEDEPEPPKKRRRARKKTAGSDG